MDDTKTVRHSTISRIVIIVVLDMLLLTLVIIMAVYVCMDRNTAQNGTNTDDQNNICLPCNDLKVHPDDVLHSAKPMETDSNICCWNETSNLQDFVREFTDNWLKKQLAEENPKYCKDKLYRKKYAFKVIGTNQQMNGKIKHLIWEKESSFAIHEKNDYLEYHPHGQIEVKKAGMYYVYSQVLFQQNNNINNSSDTQLLPMHTINVRVEGSTSIPGRVHMKRMTTHCVSTPMSRNFTSYLGSAMLLNKGDRIGVQVHDKLQVLQIPHMNFFGVHML